MKIKIKKRLIWATAVLAIGAIFLPLLFHDSHPTASLSMVTTVPRAPDKPETQLQLSQSLMTEEKVTKERAPCNNDPHSLITETKEKSSLSNACSALEPVSSTLRFKP